MGYTETYYYVQKKTDRGFKTVFSLDINKAYRYKFYCDHNAYKFARGLKERDPKGTYIIVKCIKEYISLILGYNLDN